MPYQPFHQASEVNLGEWTLSTVRPVPAADYSPTTLVLIIGYLIIGMVFWFLIAVLAVLAG